MRRGLSGINLEGDDLYEDQPLCYTVLGLKMIK